MLIRPPASFSGAREPTGMMMTADLQSACLHAWLLWAWAWAWGGGEKPQIHRAPEREGRLVYPLPIQRGTWRARSWEGRIDCVGGGGGGIDPGFEEEELLWSSRRSLQGDQHIPGCGPRWEQQTRLGQ